MSALDRIQEEVESLESVVATEVHEDHPKGVILHATLAEDYEGEGENVADDILENHIPRELVGEHQGENVKVYYDSVEIPL